MKQYLLGVAFCTGNGDVEDTDEGLFLLCVDKEFSENEMKEVFRAVNGLLNCFNEDDEESFPILYGQGLNIDTFMEGVSLYTGGEVKAICNNAGALRVDNYCIIEQWQ